MGICWLEPIMDVTFHSMDMYYWYCCITILKIFCNFVLSWYEVWSLNLKNIIAFGLALNLHAGFRWDRQWLVVNSKGRACTQRTEPKLALVEVELPKEAFSEGWEPNQKSCLGKTTTSIINLKNFHFVCMHLLLHAYTILFFCFSFSSNLCNYVYNIGRLN